MNSVPPDTRVFQHLASCTQRVTALRGNTQARLGFIHLRTVIVTADVYRGLVSELRLAANPST